MKFACELTEGKILQGLKSFSQVYFKVVLRLRLLLGLVKPSIYCRAASPKSGRLCYLSSM